MSEESREQEYQNNMRALEKATAHRAEMMTLWDSMSPELGRRMKKALLLDIKDILREEAREYVSGLEDYSDADKGCLLEFAECDTERLVMKIKKL